MAKSAAEILDKHLNNIKAGHNHLILKQLHDEVIELIGEDEIEIFPQINVLEKERLYGIQNGRNKEKAALRTKVDEYFKKESTDG